jgi:hypothetical protein
VELHLHSLIRLHRVVLSSIRKEITLMFFFLIRIVVGGVQTGSTPHVGYFWPIVPVPGDCED